jgi:hypothetical protein
MVFIFLLLRRARYRCVLPLLHALVFVPAAQAQEPDPTTRKQARASRTAPGAMRLDGRLDEEAWLRAAPVTDFVQAEPVEGAPPADPMEVRFLYDDTALWIGARMRGSPGVDVKAPMTRRDEGGQADYLQIELDTYLDRRTAYMFGVTAAGVRLDHYHPVDDEDDPQDDFDPVWEAQTAVQENGWTAELWLPFTQLRFVDSVERVWGLNIKRWRPVINEETYWIVIGRTESGWSSRFGELRGIDGVRPAGRLEVLPYVAASSRMSGGRDLANPFDNGVNLRQRVGGDLKVGIGSNLTLEATVNPDFGQIEADPAEVNLSVFETFFSERRPFFLEGNNLLRGPTGNFYYSRRIGATPIGPADGHYVDYPDTTTILGAAKLTGRLSSGTSLGMLGAITGEEHARINTGQLFGRSRVSPRAAYGIARVQQEFGAEGSTYGFMATAVHRVLADQDPLASLMTRTALTALGDVDLRFADRTYQADVSIGFTYVEGQPEALARIQRANSHLFQRPDQPTVRLDTTRTSLGGTQVRAGLDKVGGRHWLWGGNVMIESPEFEPSDFGQLRYAGDMQANARLRWRETQPGSLLRSYELGVNAGSASYFDTALGARVNVNTSAEFTFLNFWRVEANYNRSFRGQDVQQTRGGPSMGTPRGWNAGGSLRGNDSSLTRWNVGGTIRRNENGDTGSGWYGSFSMRPAPAWQFAVYPEYNQEVFNRQFLTSREGGRADTYGRRYIFGAIDRSTLSMQIRVSYIFKPDMTLDVYAEPFAASGDYDRFGELLAARSRHLLYYGTGATTLAPLADGSQLITDGADSFTLANADFNVRSFRSNIVLRWEWRPGSTLFVVWQQNRSGEVRAGDHVGIGDLFGSFSAPGDNVLAVKTTLWLAR